MVRPIQTSEEVHVERRSILHPLGSETKFSQITLRVAAVISEPVTSSWSATPRNCSRAVLFCSARASQASCTLECEHRSSGGRTCLHAQDPVLPSSRSQPVSSGDATCAEDAGHWRTVTRHPLTRHPMLTMVVSGGTAKRGRREAIAPRSSDL